MKLPDNVIQEIAQELDIGGMLCYIHKEAKEFKAVIDPDVYTFIFLRKKP